MRCLGYFDDAFPAVLRTIPDPPLVLYVLGSLDWLGQPVVAIIGARRATALGRTSALAMAEQLGRSGVHIVSGLAYGIDAAAHQGALKSGSTSAILGSGLLEVYPKSHVPISREIQKRGGALISELPPYFGPRSWQFPERNRLISGLANAVVVVEAGERSGSLITARLALEQGREVFAVPGAINNRVSRGSHRLIKEGAALATGADDVLEGLGLSSVDTTSLPTQEVETESPRKHKLSEREQFLLEHLQGYGTDVEALVRLTGMPAQEVSAMLGSLELLGIVRRNRDGYIAATLN